MWSLWCGEKENGSGENAPKTLGIFFPSLVPQRELEEWRSRVKKCSIFHFKEEVEFRRISNESKESTDDLPHNGWNTIAAVNTTKELYIVSWESKVKIGISWKEYVFLQLILLACVYGNCFETIKINLIQEWLHTVHLGRVYFTEPI